MSPEHPNPMLERARGRPSPRAAGRDDTETLEPAARAAFGEAGIREINRIIEWTPSPYVTANFGFARMTAKCVSMVVETWSDRLGGVDVFTPSHCRRMVFTRSPSRSAL